MPVGFISDIASVPAVLWGWLPSWGKYGKAAVLHDYVYQTHCRTRKEGDKIFREAMLVSGVSSWKACLMYWGVRLFGWLGWGQVRWFDFDKGIAVKVQKVDYDGQ